MTSIRLKIEESWYASMDCKVQKSGPWVCFYGGHSTGYKLGNHPKNIEPCAHRARTVRAPCDNAPKNHPSRHSSIALPVPEVPKMSVGAICFTSSGSNGGCWVVLVFPHLFFFLKNGFFFPIRDLRQKKKVYATYTKKKINFRRKKNATYAKKKKLRDLRQKIKIKK